MRVPVSGVKIDNPAFPLLLAGISYLGITTANGAATGDTVVDDLLLLEPSYDNMAIKILSGASAGQLRPITLHPAPSNTLSIPATDPFTDNTGAVNQILTGTLFVVTSFGGLGGGGGSTTNGDRPYMTHLETWQDPLGIDFTLWNVTHPATGTAWGRGAGTGVMAADLRALSAPNANETARLVSTMQWPIGPDLWGANSIPRALHFDFEMALANVANLDNTLTLFGLSNIQAATRASNDIIIFGLNADVLETVTDVGGVEETNTGFLETLTNKNKFGIAIRAAAIDFYLNGVLIATHAVSLPDVPMYLNWFLDTEAGGAATIQLGINRVWWEDHI